VIKRLKSIGPKEQESAVHNLIAPRFHRFESGHLVDEIYMNNVWILDDKFMTFRTVLSEQTMTDLIKAITLDEEDIDEGRPDISLVFSGDPEAGDKVDVVVVELKRRANDQKEALWAGGQLLQRARKLVDRCPNLQRVWYYGIVEIDDDTAQLLRDSKWVPLYSKSKLFYQNFDLQRKATGEVVPTPTFLLSFDSLIDDASTRNHAFLELLKDAFRKKDSSPTQAEEAPVAATTPTQAV
jgi:hypothetical protein